jgi:hypothetical protein
MLLLATTTDKFQVVTTAAGQIDVHTSYVDLNPSASPQTAPAPRDVRINTATTTDVVLSPASGVTRNVKFMTVGNNHASVTNTVSLQRTDGTTTVVIEQVTLAPLERMSYIEGHGIRVFDALGREKTPTAPLAQGGGNTADVVANAADTVIAQLFAGSRVVAGSGALFRCRMSKTGAGVAAATFNLRTGALGTTGDTARVTHTMTAQTAVVDDGQVEISAVIRALGAAAVLESSLLFTHTGASVGLDSGIGANLNKRLQATSSVFTLGNADFLSLTCNPGASGVWTFQEALVIPFGLTG